MAAPASVQMNMRIDATLKERGDRVLAAVGYTPTQAVRGLWDYIVAHADSPDAIHAVIDAGGADDSEADAVRERLGCLARGRLLCRSLGALPADVCNQPCKELRSSACAERYEASVAGGVA